jgi:predicted phosphodiesterase
MRLAITADLHGRWQEAAAFAQRHSCEAILVAGDLGEAAYSVPWPVPVYWVWGDDDSRLVWPHLQITGQVGDCHLIPSWTTVTIDGLVLHAAGWHRQVSAGSCSYDIFDDRIRRAVR